MASEVSRVRHGDRGRWVRSAGETPGEWARSAREVRVPTPDGVYRLRALWKDMQQEFSSLAFRAGRASSGPVCVRMSRRSGRRARRLRPIPCAVPEVCPGDGRFAVDSGGVHGLGWAADGRQDVSRPGRSVARPVGGPMCRLRTRPAAQAAALTQDRST